MNALEAVEIRKQDALADVNTTNEQVAYTQRLLAKAVEEARVAGCTWQEIGDSLGITRQAAHERFNK